MENLQHLLVLSTLRDSEITIACVKYGVSYIVSDVTGDPLYIFVLQVTISWEVAWGNRASGSMCVHIHKGSVNTFVFAK